MLSKDLFDRIHLLQSIYSDFFDSWKLHMYANIHLTVAFLFSAACFVYCLYSWGCICCRLDW